MNTSETTLESMKNMTKHKAALRSDLIILTVATLVTCFLFKDSRLDLWAASQFFHPENLNDPINGPWFEEHYLLWKFFYFSAPWLSGLILLGSLGVFVGAQFTPKLRAKRKYAAFAFLVILIGSGFLINTVLKPYWGRPRPREVLELGGNKPYQAFYQPNLAGPGKSFPCGHCSVGFSYGILAWILRRKKPKLAAALLGGSILFGFLMGFGRMAAGGHFLSDVFFAGLIIYWSCFAVYYLILKIPKLEQLSERDPKNEGLIFGKSLLPQNRPLQTLTYAALGLATISVLLIATPYHYEYALTGFLTETPEGKIQHLVIEIDAGQVEVKVSESIKTTFRIDGNSQGFGFPGSKIYPACTLEKTKNICTLSKTGFFSDLENKVLIQVRPDFIQNLTVQLKEGEFIQHENNLPESYRLIEPIKH